MADRGAFDRAEVRLGVAPVEPDAVPDPGTAFRIAVLGDFSARGSRAGAALRDPADRPPVLVDRDNIDEVMARLGPELHLRGDDDTPEEVVRVTGLDDLHPDSLYDRLPSLSALRDLRKRAADPRTARQAVREVLGQPERPAPRAPRRAPSGASLLEQIVTETAGAPARPEDSLAPAEDELSRFVRKALVGSIVDPADPRQPELLARLDGAITARMRAVLHDPGFQAVEALWRGVQLLVRRLETGPELKVYLVDVTRDELAADLAGEGPVEGAGLYRLLVDGSVGTPGAAPWSLLVGCFGFGPEPGDVALLARIAEIARAAGAPWLSAAEPLLAGWPSFEATPEPESWSAPESPEWEALRGRPEAASVGLVAPRFILRLPYGASTDACEQFRFEEVDDPPMHDAFLWGNGAIAAALLLAETFSLEGWGMRPGARAEVGGCPLHVMRAGGLPRALPCAESLMPERSAGRMLEAGVMPLATLKDSDTVRLVRFQSIARPAAALAGRWRADRR